MKTTSRIPKAQTSLPKCQLVYQQGKAEWRRYETATPVGAFDRVRPKNPGDTANALPDMSGHRPHCLRVATPFQPNGVPKQRPEYYIMRDALQELRQFIALFGLSPSARMRLQIPEPEHPDEMEALLD